MTSPAASALLAALLVAGCARGEANEPLPDQPYQEGLTLLTAGGQANTELALGHFRRALAVDSTFVPAWVGVARAHYNLGPNASILSPEETLVPAREAAESAVRFGPDDPEAHLVLANVRAADWDWRGAELAFARALELDPSSVPAMNGLATTLYTMNRESEAADVLKRALAAQPEGGLILRSQLLDDAEAAIEILSDRIVAAGPSPTPNDFFILARIYGAEGRYEEAVQQLERQIPLMNGDVADETALLGYFHGRLGKEAEARRALSLLDGLVEEGRYVSPVQRAWVHLGLGERELALELLAKAVDAHAHRTGGGMRGFGFVYESVASDPRFVALLARMGMVV
jgi:tetratricopeptide (TPR) repeat protein